MQHRWLTPTSEWQATIVNSGTSTHPTWPSFQCGKAHCSTGSILTSDHSLISSQMRLWTRGTFLTSHVWCLLNTNLLSNTGWLSYHSSLTQSEQDSKVRARSDDIVLTAGGRPKVLSVLSLTGPHSKVICRWHPQLYHHNKFTDYMKQAHLPESTKLLLPRES